MRGVREGGLGGVDVALPLGQLVCLRGVSGSGAQILARKVLLGESRRRYLLSLTPFERQRLGGVGVAADVDGIEGLPPARHLPRPKAAGATVIAALHLGTDLQQVVRARCQVACSRCAGPCLAFHEDQVAARMDAEFPDEACLVVAPLALHAGAAAASVLAELGRAGFRRIRFAGERLRLDEGDLPESLCAGIAATGIVEVIIDRLAPPRRPGRVGEAVRTARALAGGRTLLVGDASGRQLWLDSRRACVRCGEPCAEPDWEAVVCGDSAAAERLRLGEAPAAQVLAGLRLGRLRSWAPADDMTEELDRIAGSARRLARAGAIAADLGLDDLPLWRSTEDLAHGELLCLEIAAARLTGLTGVLYVVTSPPSALDLATAARALAGLRVLVQQGSSVVVLDAAPGAEGWADATVDLAGPGKDPTPVRAAPTAAVQPSAPAPWTSLFVAAREGVRPARDLTIPLGGLVVLTGPTGSGKSALLRRLYAALSGGVRDRGVVAPAVRRCLDLQQAAAACSGLLLDALGLSRPLARVFAAAPAAQGAGLGPEAFRLDRAGGRCPACEGRGSIRHRLDLVEDIVVPCNRCGGRRFQDPVLQVTCHGLSIAETLALTVDEAAERFARERGLAPCLRAARRVGLGGRRLHAECAQLEGLEPLLAQLARLATTTRRGDLALVDRPLAGCSEAEAGLLVAGLRDLDAAGAGVLATDASGRLEGHADHRLDLSPS